MINHTDLGDKPFTHFRALQALIIKGDISLAGYRKNKIYGTLTCKAGKRINPENRIFSRTRTKLLTRATVHVASVYPANIKNGRLKT
ncbi:hypothetical protein [Mucilaginibacter antarcticus]|uniref:hypothetical protein n=1 Tax=Mucilaginibacter antarcticus TaxID=1855725 RepID=UPI003631505D